MTARDFWEIPVYGIVKRIINYEYLFGSRNNPDSPRSSERLLEQLDLRSRIDRILDLHTLYSGNLN